MAAPLPSSAAHSNPQYAQAPPAYTPNETSGDARSPLMGAAHTSDHLGGPRNSEDNLPDDFKYGQTVSEATLPLRMQFIRKVYSILTIQLLATAALSSVSFFNKSYRHWIQSHQGLMWVSLFGAIGMLLLTYWKRKSYPTNLLFLAGFTAAEAYSISVVVSFYKSGIVLQALVITLGIFVFLTLFACQTKYDFSAWQPYLFGSLWILIIFGLMAMFFPRSSTSELIFGGLGALVFSAYILFDTQQIMRKYDLEEEIAAAISLYLDVINLFLSILRVLNSQQNN